MSSYNINLDNDISTLRISLKTEKLLKSNNIYTLKELVRKNKNELKKMKFAQDEINDIEIKLQLQGLDLNMKC